ncbi:MAG TPA: beta family protein [Thermoguttaceae bacterium]|nr:beta family protein [Thermoguttaceae bacterium]
MKFDHNHYVPCLRWKQGEYQAVLDLSTTARNFITPLIEVPEMGFDFEKGVDSKTIDKHLEPFAKRVHGKWGTHPCFVDVLHIPSEKVMADGGQPVSFVLDKLRAAGCSAVPVTGLFRNSGCQRAVKRAVSRDGRGLCLRVTIEEAAKPSLKVDTDALLAKAGVNIKDCDLIFDLGAPNFEPVEGFAKLVETLIRKLPYLARWRTFTLMGTSFPSTMAEIKRGPATIPRYEWVLYKRLVGSLRKAKVRLPTFGDYGISHPDLLLLDMRKLKPSATIRYTTDDDWFIVKGPNVRENGFGQYRDHCRMVIASGSYMGPSFSEGDRHISECAAGSASTGNLTTWRKVGTNHHLEKVVRDVSNLFGSSAAS